MSGTAERAPRDEAHVGLTFVRLHMGSRIVTVVTLVTRPARRASSR
jgi:hypothetical protein